MKKILIVEDDQFVSQLYKVKLEALGYEESLVSRVLKLTNRAEFKRHQTPLILRVSSKAFGSGRRLPIVGKYLES
mgnify:CR=1 FL=1